MDEQVQQQVVQLVQAAMQGDQEAAQYIQQVMQAAQQGDQEAAEIAQIIQAVAQQMQQAKQVKAAKFGATLNYIRSLRGMCPVGYEMQYFKSGGKVCKKCIKKNSEGSSLKEKNKPSHKEVSRKTLNEFSKKGEQDNSIKEYGEGGKRGKVRKKNRTGEVVTSGGKQYNLYEGEYGWNSPTSLWGQPTQIIYQGADGNNIEMQRIIDRRNKQHPDTFYMYPGFTSKHDPEMYKQQRERFNKIWNAR